MPSSRLSFPAVGALLLLAGCLGQPAAPGPGAGAPEADAALSGGWARDCSITNWADPCTAKATRTQGPANELMLAVNPTDPANVVVGAKDYSPEGSDCVWAGTSVTKDGGRTWANGFVGGARADRDPRLLAFDCVTDPVLEFGADGTLYYVVEAYSVADDEDDALGGLLGAAGPVGTAMWLAASLDGGITWELRGLISSSPGGPVLFHDKSDLAVSPLTGTLVASWTAFGAVAQLLYTRSTDGGLTWAPPQVLMEATRAQEATAMVDLEYAPDGRLHAVWFNWDTGEVMYAASEDDGASFGAPRTLAEAHPWTGQSAPNSQFRLFDSPMLAVDASDGPRRGWLYLTWADDALFAGDHDVWFARSEDGGATWGRPIQVGSHTGTDQFHPNLAVARDGSVHLFSYDRQHDAANRLLDVSHALSLDAGERWAVTRVTAGSFDGDLGIHQSGVPFMGDYNGIAAGGDAVYLAYADTREGRSDVAVAKFVLAPAGR